MSLATPLHRHRTVPPALAVATVALLAVIALTIVLAATGSFGSNTQSAVADPSSGTGLNAAALYASANPGVVDITHQSASGTDTGTGFVLDTQGHIVTADHVVAGSGKVTVTLQGGATRAAKVLGSDTGTDVAVLAVDPSGLSLHPLTLGTLTGHRVGDPVAVIGDPFDVQRSLSTGVISGLDRSIQAPNGFAIPHAVQTDAAINPGNSGGPVFDAGGRVIGIADQIATGGSGSDSSTGVGFAVSIDVIKSELSQLKAGTTPAHAFLGVSTGDATDSNGDTGALVGSVQPGGPAARAGVRPGDLIVAIGRTKITGTNDLIAATAGDTPGQRTTVTVMRDGKRIALTTTLGKQPTGTVAG
jgi:putative serine protease PepD